MYSFGVTFTWVETHLPLSRPTVQRCHVVMKVVLVLQFKIEEFTHSITKGHFYGIFLSACPSRDVQG